MIYNRTEALFLLLDLWEFCFYAWLLQVPTQKYAMDTYRSRNIGIR